MAGKLSLWLVLVDPVGGVNKQLYYRRAKTPKGACDALAKANPAACALAAPADEMPKIPGRLDNETIQTRRELYVGMNWLHHACRANNEWPELMAEESKRRSINGYKPDILRMLG